jgi:hypothetical protein
MSAFFGLERGLKQASEILYLAENRHIIKQTTLPSTLVLLGCLPHGGK